MPSLRFLLAVLLILMVVEAQYRMMANYGPAWRQKLWRKTRIPTYTEPEVQDGLMDLLGD